jgi:uncharacterized protein with PQ loop repeat
MKESDSKRGLLGWSIGLVSLIFSVIQPIAGFIFAIAGIVINSKNKDDWSKTGKKLSVLALIISIVLFLVAILFYQYGAEIIAQTGSARKY